MKQKIIVIFVLSAILGCKKEVKPVLISETVSEKFGSPCENEPCAEVTLDYLRYTGDAELSEEINSKINIVIIGMLELDGDLKNPDKNILEATQEFMARFEADKQEFPETTAGYTSEIVISEAYKSDELLCLEAQHYSYTGGAHGYGSIFYINLDPQTGAQLSTKDLLDIPKFMVFAENKFREENEIAANKSINSTGFWFENDAFSLPETIGFTSESLILLYNQYNIASYADGPIELRISRKEASAFLRFDE